MPEAHGDSPSQGQMTAWSLMMIRYLLALFVLLASLAAHAQTHAPAVNHGVYGANPGSALKAMPTQPGQGAFAAIQEIVAMLDADPNTDWSKVDIDGLRRHLVDMNNVTLHAEVTTTPTEKGVRFVVTGTGPVRESIRRMVKAHAETMSGVNGMIIVTKDYPEGAVMTFTVENLADLPKLEGLGFFGIMTIGMHHQAHHLMIASGRAPHH